jgi:glutamate synthase domain-containing protein 2/glutamate synthase domain-containing protein 1/glutamate synthase domain-containing protein 3
MTVGWDPRAERSACGIGFVADASGHESRRVVELGIEALRRLEHRGAAAGDGVTGDGAGLLLPIPRDLLGDELGLSSDERRTMGVAMLFARGDTERRLPALLRNACAPERIEAHELRTVPVEPGALGPAAVASAPTILQAVIGPAPGHSVEPAVAHRIRRRLERDVAAEGLDAYVVSLGFRTVTYKALVRASQLDGFYPDLRDERCRGWFAIFHQRYSTNTSPGWERAQPFRALCHNGEINTLSGNAARMRAREGGFGTGDAELEDLLRPSIDERGSDSSMLDETIDLLVSHGSADGEPRDVRHAIAMTVPRAWEHDPAIDEDARAFYRWHESRMEPWDGPAALVFTDGLVVGAALDRNGLRPMRYAATDDGLVVCASETGVVDLDGRRVRLGRLGPGQMLAVDPAAGGLQLDPLAPLVTERPYGRWLERERTVLLPVAFGEGPDDLSRSQVAHGLTREDLTIAIRAMSSTGHEPTFSMGDDTPIPPLAQRSRPVTAFLRQRFAQVTNPALDHLREGWVMSLRTLLGARPALLTQGPADRTIVELDTFLLEGVPAGPRLDATWDPADGPDGLEAVLRHLVEDAAVACRAGADVLVVTHEPAGAGRAPVPSVLAVGAIHTGLVERGLRPSTSIVVVADDAFGSHDAACLLTCGADAIVPRLALATVTSLFVEGRLPGAASAQEVRARYRTAVEEGVRKSMSRLGISVLDSYRGARALDALGLADEVIDRCFPGVVSPIGGLGFRALGEQVLERWSAAFGNGRPTLANPGAVKYHRGGEYHGTNPDVVRALHRSVDPGLTKLRSTAAGADDDTPADDNGAGSNGNGNGASGNGNGSMAETHLVLRASAGLDEAAFARFVHLVERRPPVSPRDLLELAPAGETIPIDRVEGADAIVARFSTAAISLGAISPEAHKALAAGANGVGARSNSGEGGEDPARFGTEANSRIKQVASARFGVTPAYLASADELQIKIAQGSKPGEGGQLPAAKVTEAIAALRHAQPGIDLISPAPHHDIYSIEDLAQLVYDLRQVNPAADVSVKLVAEVGVGTIAAGVTKALADVVHVSGSDGGTGASPLASIKHAGLPWELGLAETRNRLIEDGLRDRVRVRVDGGFRIGRDVVIAALLGADEFSFGTAVLLAQGCLMVRTCHLDTCPVGIATQRPELRARFAGTPEMVSGYLTLVAQDVRRILALLGLRSIDEAIGRTDLLRADAGRVSASGLDLSPLLETTAAGGSVAASRPARARSALGDRLAEEAVPALLGGERRELTYTITNRDRTVGARLGGAMGAALGDRTPTGAVRVALTGDAGQSLGAFLTEGVEIRLVGTANDGVGKGMAGGRIVLSAPPRTDDGPVLVGNAALYGATGGELFVAGGAGERFAVRNSGATAVVEGVGANGCEYMTGGVVVVLGEIGPNFAAGMTGGLAYLFDPAGSLGRFVNPDLVDIVDLATDGRHELADLLRRHVRHTGSEAAGTVLASWPEAASAFRLVAPKAPMSLTAPDATTATTSTTARTVYENETPAVSTGNIKAL